MEFLVITDDGVEIPLYGEVWLFSFKSATDITLGNIQALIAGRRLRSGVFVTTFEVEAYRAHAITYISLSSPNEHGIAEALQKIISSAGGTAVDDVKLQQELLAHTFEQSLPMWFARVGKQQFG